jgi:6-carboxyhexanoate--CoA ligase
MTLYSLKMRASRHTAAGNEHISGAEKILYRSELAANLDALLRRALYHAKGTADSINLKIEAIQPQELLYLDALPVKTIAAATPADGRQAILDCLAKAGLENGTAIMARFHETYAMRGAMLLDADTLERLEPDHARGLRATYMDAVHAASRNPSESKDHFPEAIVLATKVVNAPHIIAEICMSDDPDYVTGYIATKDTGYVRITKLKNPGCPDGGRIFLYRGPKEDVPACINYLEKQHVLVRKVPASPTDNAVPAASDPYRYIRQQLAHQKEAHLYRSLACLESVQAAHVHCQGQDRLLLASNNYLGLIEHPAVKKAAARALESFGSGSGGSRLTTGNLPLHEKLEQALAHFKHTEAAILFDTGYMANVGTISALGQHDDIIFSDELNHASIIDGCRLSQARTVVYQHNDMHDLAEKLRIYSPGSGLIISEAVFSMDGDIADLPSILQLGRKYHLLTMIDEAHSTGVLGPTGHGICEYFPAAGMPDILMGTLSKSLASEGGYVCGRQLLIDFLRNQARSFIFSTSQSPANLAAASAALYLLQHGPERVARLQHNIAFFCAELTHCGIPVHSRSAIIPIIIGSETATMQIAHELFQQDIIVSAIRYPTVAKGQARLRLALMSTHTDEDLHCAAQKIAGTIRSHHINIP